MFNQMQEMCFHLSFEKYYFVEPSEEKKTSSERYLTFNKIHVFPLLVFLVCKIVN